MSIVIHETVFQDTLKLKGRKEEKNQWKALNLYLLKDREQSVLLAYFFLLHSDKESREGYIWKLDHSTEGAKAQNETHGSRRFQFPWKISI